MFNDWRIARMPLLLVAWALMGVSLILPLTWDDSKWMPMPYIPTGLLIISGFVNTCARPLGPGLLILFPFIAFISTPLLIVRRPRGTGGIIWFLGALSLLAVWVVPLCEGAYKVSNPSAPQGSSSLAFGYYVYAAAHMLAFIACMLTPTRGSHLEKASRKAGFPVLSPSEQRSP
jgi:hypothetical protein